MRKKRAGEQVCQCSAYRFSHRFGGGRCTGFDIVEDTWNANFGCGDCTQCISLDSTDDVPYCQVEKGQENVTWCPVWREFVLSNEIKLYKELYNQFNLRL